jgi:hypothetical protein
MSVLGRDDVGMPSTGTCTGHRSVIDLHNNGRLHPVYVYEGSTDENGNTVLGKLKHIITTNELQKRADEFPTMLGKSLTNGRIGTLNPDLPVRPCKFCHANFLPRYKQSVFCSDKCRRGTARHYKREKVAAKLGIDVSELTQNRMGD